MSFLEPLRRMFVSFFHRYSRGSIAFFFLFTFISCSTPTSQWSIDKVEAINPRHNSTRLVYSDKNARLELYQTFNESVGYFSVTSLPIQPLPEDPSKSKIHVTIDREEEIIIAYRLSGGQKLLLPETTLIKITTALKEHLPVTLKSGRYTLNIPPFS